MLWVQATDKNLKAIIRVKKCQTFTIEEWVHLEIKKHTQFPKILQIDKV